MRLYVLRFNDIENYHECKALELDIIGPLRVDLLVDGLLMAPDELVGKMVEVDYLTPYVSIASGVRVLSESEAL